MIADDNAAEIGAAAVERGAALVLGRAMDRSHAVHWAFEKIRRGRREALVELNLAALRNAGAGPSSLFQPAFIETHLEGLAQAAHASGRPLSLAVLKVQLAPGARPATASGWRRGVYQVCEIAGRLVRSHDSAALLDGDLIVIALPDAGAAEARGTAERVASVSECTAFAAGEADAGPIVLEQGVVELAAGESGAGLLARARAAFEAEGALA
jgi:PleD family two-component response regulator